MSKKSWVIVALAVLIVAVGVGGFFIGRGVEINKAKAEKEYNIKLSKSELEGLGEIEGTIYVTGHKIPDSDTVGSAIAYAALLRKLGYDAVPAVIDKINSETKYILEQAGENVPALLENAAGQNIVLVDHGEYSQTVDGLESANILCIIDHHNAGTITSAKPIIYDARPIGSASTIIWMRYRDYGVEIDKNIAIVLLGGILSDTSNLMSNDATTADREAVKALQKLSGVTDVDAFYRDIYKASISYNGMTDKEIFFSDYREYEEYGVKFSIGCVNAYDDDIAKKLAERMRALLPKVKGDIDISYAQISIFHDDISVTYLVPSDEEAAKVIEEAFGDRAVFDGTSYRLEPGMSRKKGVVPAITDVLQKRAAQ